MAAITQFLLGKNVTITITPQDRASNGTLSNNAIGALTFVGKLESVQGGSLSLKTDNISPMDSFQENPVPFEQSVVYSITEYMGAVAVSAADNKLRKAIQTSFYWLMTIVLKDNAASPATMQTETVYVLAEGYDPTYVKGACRGRVTLRAIDISTVNPAFS